MPDYFAGYSESVKKFEKDSNDAKKKIKETQNIINSLYDNNNANELISNHDELFDLFEKANIEIGDTMTIGDLTDDQKDKLSGLAKSLINDYEKEIRSFENQIDSRNKELGKYIVSSIQGTESYEELDNNQQGLVNALISNLDYSNYSEEMAKAIENNDWDSAFEIINRDILSSFYGMTPENKEKFQSIYSELLKIDPDASLEENTQIIKEYIAKLAELLGIESSKLQIALGYDLNSNNQKVSDAKSRLGYEVGTHVNYDKNAQARNQEISDFVDSLSEEELDFLATLSIDEDTKRMTTEELEKWFKEQQENAELEVTPKFNPTTSIASAKEAFSGFESIYDEIMGGGTVSADSINELTDTFGEINGGLALEHFRDVLTTMPDDTEAQKQALNDLATAYLDQSELMQNLTEENKDYVISELEKINIENAEEYVESRLNDTTKQLLGNLSKFGKVYADNYNAIKNATEGSEEYEQSLQNLKNGLNELLSYEIDGEMFSFDVSDNFVVENLEDIEAAANGSIEALYRVKQAATQDYVMNMSINAPSTSEMDYVRQEINDLIANFDINEFKVGASLDDTELIAGLNHFLDAGKITKNQMEAILSGLEVTPTETYRTLYIDTPQLDPTGHHVVSRKKEKIQIPIVKYVAGKRGASANYVGGYGGSSSGGGGGGGGSSSSANETSETFDWVETKITRLEEAIDRLDKTVSNTYDNWTNRNKALSSEISKVKEEINLQQQAYNRYMQEANKVGLSSTYAKKIQNGELNIETIKDEGLIEKVNLYKEWFEKATACSDAIQDLKINLGELAELQFNNISQEYSDLISLIEGSADLVDERISRTEEQGYFASSSYYQQMLNYEAQEMARLNEEYNKLIDQRNAAVSSGAITQGSEAYQAMTQEIQGVHQAIEESTTAMVEFNNAIRDLNWEIFDYIEERIGKIADESNFLIDLLDNQSLYNENGSFNNRGQSTAYLHGKNAQIYAQQAQDYANELRKINADLANDPSNKTLIERREELLDLQQESISNIYAEKEAVKSLVEEGINKHLQALTELIDKYKNAMNEAKSLYEYNQSIADQTSEISRLQKILQSYEGDDGEESRKAIQEYQNQLKDAQESLKETEWSQFISETENLLDDLYSDYEETLNARLDNIDTLFTDVINGANANAYMINETIKSVAQAVGYDISMINKNPQDIKNSIQQKITSPVQLKGYATGSYRIPYDQWALTQEDGTELIYHASNGAILTRVGENDMVFTHEMSKNLWEIAQGNLPDFMSGFKAPTMVAKANTTSVNNQNAISISLPNVTNYDEFKNALQKDSKFVGFMQEVTLGQALGKNKLNKNKY